MKNERTGEAFHYSTVANILRNVMYTGVLRSGESHSDIIPELQIISPEQFERVGKGLEQRSVSYANKCEPSDQKTVTLFNGDEVSVARPHRTTPVRGCGQSLLSGNVYCGHCGARIFSSTTKRTGHSGNEDRIRVYRCYSRAQHKQQCDGPSTYQAAKVDRVIDQILLGIFKGAKSVDEQELIQREVEATQNQYLVRLKQVKADYAKASKEYAKWENLMLDSIEGTCVFTPEQVKGRMDKVHEDICVCQGT